MSTHERPQRSIRRRRRHSAHDEDVTTLHEAPSPDTVPSLQHQQRNPTPQGILALQRQMGNQYVRQKVLGRSAHVQRFGSQEHTELGNAPTNSRQYKLHDDPSAYEFYLTHGDIVALSGDYFDPRDTITDENGNEIPNPDSLFLMAKRPSLRPGKDLGTQDEIVYAIKKYNEEYDIKDRRFEPGGIWADIVFSDEIKDAYSERYLRLAAANREHFVAPSGTAGGPGSGNRASAGGSYRALHEAAILMAFQAGQSGGSVDEAMAREAAAQHFLTDHFAAGHIRTPRDAIRTFWAAKYPNFWANLQRKIAMEVAIYINDHDNIGYLATVNQLYDQILTSVQEATEGMPPLGFDDLVSMVAHDFDNEQGLQVTNDLGHQWTTYGDSHLHDNPETAQYAELAVRLGVDDIQHAFEFGKRASGQADDASIFAEVRRLSSSPARPTSDTFAPEQVFPRLDPAAENGTQNWQADSVDALWSMKIRSDKDTTYGEEITKSLQDKEGELRKQMQKMADKFPESQDALGVFTVHPRAGFEQGFLAKLRANPQNELRSIIDFNPSLGQAFFNEDDIVMEETADMTKQEREAYLRGLTVNQRADRIKNLLSGWTGDDEQEHIVELFRTAPAGDRPQLYRQIEGHEWNGDFRHGWLVIDDDLWDDLSSDRLTTLRTLINGG